MDYSWNELRLILPLIVIFAVGFLILGVGLILPSKREGRGGNSHFILPFLGLVGVVGSWVSLFYVWNTPKLFRKLEKGSRLEKSLEKKELNQALEKELKRVGIVLSQRAKIYYESNRWHIVDGAKRWDLELSSEGLSIYHYGEKGILSGSLVVDNFGLLFCFLITIALFLAILMSQEYASRMGYHHGEYYALLFFASGSLMAMALSYHLLTLFVAMETLSLSVYALAGMSPRQVRSQESALKYFILGSFASAFLLYGICLLYGATGSLDLRDPAYRAVMDTAHPYFALFLSGICLITFALAFKVGAVPFHWWVPDVYEGAPTPITGFMSTAVKVGGFALMARVVYGMFRWQVLQDFWMPVVWILAVITMLVGSVLALWQRNIKRLLAYSSVVHGGYLLIAIYVVGSAGQGVDLSPSALHTALGSIPFYLAAYTFITMGAFAVVISLARNGEDREDFEYYTGLAHRKPKRALALTIFLLALAGIPPTAGFVGKFYVFKAAIEGGFYVLALLGILASVVSLYYYLRVVVIMYMHPAEESFDQDFDPWGVKCAIAISLAAVVVLGVLPAGWLAVSQYSAFAFVR
ncbi:MAG: NADH-quinone oxidoreductase subunit N [Planctomycetota bacterium]|nr:MAG: NADH-quinone oxidoreductase subunit N [Planctomycetota bacterium]